MGQDSLVKSGAHTQRRIPAGPHWKATHDSRRCSRGAPLQRGIDFETSMRRGGHDWMLLMPADVRRKNTGVGGGAQL